MPVMLVGLIRFHTMCRQGKDVSFDSVLRALVDLDTEVKQGCYKEFPKM